MDSCLLFPSTGTFNDSTLPPGEARSILSRPDFLVSRSLPRARGRGIEVTRISGRKQFAAYAKWDRDLHFWKTCQGFFSLTISAKSLETWRNAGSMRNGTLYPQRPSERRIFVKDSGYSLGFVPTPQGIDKDFVKMSFEACRKRGGYRQTLATITKLSHGGELNPEWVEYLLRLPIGWTALNVLATYKYLLWQRSHSAFLLREFPEIVKG